MELFYYLGHALYIHLESGVVFTKVETGRHAGTFDPVDWIMQESAERHFWMDRKRRSWYHTAGK